MRNRNLTIAVFTSMNFVLAMASSVFSGILDEIAVSLGVSVANAGLLTTMYSYGAVFGVLITLALSRKIERSKMLKMMLFLTILTTTALVLAQSLWQMVWIRLVMGTSCFSYNVLAISTVSSLAGKERQGRAMAILIAGNASALVVGIPLTRALSSILSWRVIFAILTCIMILAFVYFIVCLPRDHQISAKLNLKEELSFFKDWNVLWVIIFTAIIFVGYGALYTYITPYLLTLFPSVEPFMVFVLALLGMASFAGNLIGGHVADRIGYATSMSLGAGLQTIFVVALIVSQQVKWLSILFALLWIMSVWFTGLQVNTGIAQATQNKSSFMISINNAGNQLGIAIGSSLAAIVASYGGIENIIYIPLFSCLVVIAIQLVAKKLSSSLNGPLPS